VIVLIVGERETNDDIVEEWRIVGKRRARKIGSNRKFELVAAWPIGITFEKGLVCAPAIVGDRSRDEMSAILQREKLD